MTTIGWSTSLFFTIAACTARAKLSVPPPGPAVAMNSIGLVGVHAPACGAMANAATPETRVTVSLNVTDTYSSSFILYLLMECALPRRLYLAGYGGGHAKVAGVDRML